ncbi:MAG: hypothetical protein GY810_30835 [Aureispira sp.]|nr:hypothetical protein [Aureispira sp.]
MNYKLILLLVLLIGNLQAQQVDFKDIKSNPAVKWATTVTSPIYHQEAQLIRQTNLDFEAINQLANIDWLQKQKVYTTKQLQKRLSIEEISNALDGINLFKHSICLHQFMYWNEQDKQLNIKPIAIGLCPTPIHGSKELEALFWVSLNPNNSTFDHKNQDISWIERQTHNILLKDLSSYKSTNDSLFLQKKLWSSIQKSPYPIYKSLKSKSPLTESERKEILYKKETLVKFHPETFEEIITGHSIDTLRKTELVKLTYVQDLAWNKAKEEFYIKTIAISPSKYHEDANCCVFTTLYYQKDTDWINSLKDYRIIESYSMIDLLNNKPVADNKTLNFKGQTLLKSIQGWDIREQLSNLNWLCSDNVKVYAGFDSKCERPLQTTEIKAALTTNNQLITAQDIQTISLKQHIIVDATKHQYTISPKALGILNKKGNTLIWVEIPHFSKTPQLPTTSVLWASQYYSQEEIDIYVKNYYASAKILEAFKQKKLTSYQYWNSTDIVTENKMDKMIHSLDTIITFDPETFEEIVQIVETEMDPEEAGPISFVQQFVWDETQQQLYIKPIRFAPSIDEMHYSDKDDFRQPFFLQQATEDFVQGLQYLDTELTFSNHLEATKLFYLDDMDSTLLDFPNTTPINIDIKWLKKTPLYADAQLTKKLSKKEAKALLIRAEVINQVDAKFQIVLDQFEQPCKTSILTTAVGVRIAAEDEPIFWLKANVKAQKNAKIIPLGQEFALEPISPKIPTAANLFTENIINNVYNNNHPVYRHWNDKTPIDQAHIDTMYHGFELNIEFNPDTFEEIISIRKFRPTIEACTDLLIWWQWDWDKKNHELICTPKGIAPMFLEDSLGPFRKKTDPLRKFCLYYLLYK